MCVVVLCVHVLALMYVCGVCMQVCVCVCVRLHASMCVCVCAWVGGCEMCGVSASTHVLVVVCICVAVQCQLPLLPINAKV